MSATLEHEAGGDGQRGGPEGQGQATGAGARQALEQGAPRPLADLGAGVTGGPGLVVVGPGAVVVVVLVLVLVVVLVVAVSSVAVAVPLARTASATASPALVTTMRNVADSRGGRTAVSM